MTEIDHATGEIIDHAGLEEIGTPESLGQLYAALAKAQAAFSPITRSKTVTIRGTATYSFAYAPLEDLLAATRPALAANGLAVLTPMVRSPGADVAMVQTILAHSGGARIISSFAFSPLGDVKQMAGQITYLRRYGYSALLNLAADDDADDNDTPMPSAMPALRAAPPRPQRTPEQVAALTAENARMSGASKAPTQEDLAAYGRGMYRADELGIDLAPYQTDKDVTRDRLLALSKKMAEAVNEKERDLVAGMANKGSGT